MIGFVSHQLIFLRGAQVLRNIKNISAGNKYNN